MGYVESKAIRIFAEPMLPVAVQDRLQPLLTEAFPSLFEGRTYFKQQPHFRIVMLDRNNLIAHVPLDYRVIRIGTEVVRICGVIDLCVRSDCRRQGIGSKLLAEAERHARKAQVAFMVLMADFHDFYNRYGFFLIHATAVKWLAIEDRTSHSLTEQNLSDCFMVKSLSGFTWPGGSVDMLGYLF